VAIKEPGKLPKVRRRYVVEDGIEIAMIGDIERVDAEPDVMSFPASVAEEWYAKLMRVRTPKAVQWLRGGMGTLSANPFCGRF
jgi:hypothetical protein